MSGGLALGGATRAALAIQLLLLRTSRSPGPIRVNGEPAQGTRWSLQGFEFDAVTLDIAGEVGVQIS